jgi:membrane-bound lytic murein transglycosylase A
MRGAALAVLFAMSLGHPATAQVLSFQDLSGWAEDDHLSALKTFLVTCDQLDGADWPPICKLAASVTSEQAAKSFFEMVFRPAIIGTPPALFTGYYEPELPGSLTKTRKFPYPIYRKPDDLRDGETYYDRKSIEAGALRGRGLEIAYLEDPVEAFFLQVQGSGRIKLTNGTTLRVGFAAANGYSYRSVGQEMVARGTVTADQISAQAIQSFVRNNPRQGKELLNVNPSYVFFRVIPELTPDMGPIGAMSRSITTLRSIAVDPSFTTLGTPVWIEKDGADPMKRLMIAQDTGGAIKGAQRADIFFGTGQAAGDAAGIIKDGGRMVQLLPIDRAFLVGG